jgi:hypothetical protein
VRERQWLRPLPPLPPGYRARAAHTYTQATRGPWGRSRRTRARYNLTAVAALLLLAGALWLGWWALH